jgi:putative acetyltransferase
VSGFEIRDGGADDLAGIEPLYADAFPDEELRPLVRALLQDTPGVLSLVAAEGAALIGHVAFTSCCVKGETVSLLGPLAVTPAWQRRGVGSALVRAGLERLRSSGISQVFVLGDPAYYRRFGFAAERAVVPPCPIPKDWQDAWQSFSLKDAAPKLRGTLTVPPAWNDPALWLP